MATRDDQREATRERILEAAVQALVTGGYSAMSTLAVQRAAGVSRGALLHHFPTRAQLSEALVGHLVARNESAVRATLSSLPTSLDPVTRAVRALYESLSQPSFQAEMELWSAARTDPELRTALRTAEREAARDLRRVVNEVFGPSYVANPSYPVVASLTIALIRGLAISRVLRTSDTRTRRLIEDWADLVRQIFELQLTPARVSAP